MLTPAFGGFPCSQAHNPLTCDQPDPKNKLSSMKKIQYSHPNLSSAPLRDPSTLKTQSLDVSISIHEYIFTIIFCRLYSPDLTVRQRLL